MTMYRHLPHLRRRLITLLILIALVVRAALFGLPARARRDHIPRAIYTSPELAQAGLTEAEAARRLSAPAATLARAEELDAHAAAAENRG